MNYSHINNIRRWSYINNLVFSAVFVVLLFYELPLVWLVLYGLLSFALFWFVNYSSLKNFTPFAGYANWITLFRLLMVAFIGLLFPVIPDIVLFIVALTAVLLDGADGFVARKTDQTSTIGAYFDMETDAFYVCILAIILYQTGYLGAWILPVGFLRYLYGAIVFILRWHRMDSVHTRFGQKIAGIFFIALPSAFILPEQYYRPLLIAAAILLTGSFALSFIKLSFMVFRKSGPEDITGDA